jgi:hypothetical protein
MVLAGCVSVVSTARPSARVRLRSKPSLYLSGKALSQTLMPIVCKTTLIGGRRRAVGAARRSVSSSALKLPNRLRSRKPPRLSFWHCLTACELVPARCVLFFTIRLVRANRHGRPQMAIRTSTGRLRRDHYPGVPSPGYSSAGTLEMASRRGACEKPSGPDRTPEPRLAVCAPLRAGPSGFHCRSGVHLGL